MLEEEARARVDAFLSVFFSLQCWRQRQLGNLLFMTPRLPFDTKDSFAVDD